MRWDIFCKVIDNYGDIGVCWRLGADLASRGEQVRLWVDDPSALVWMAPGGCSGVEIKLWTRPYQDDGAVPGDVLIEAFGCDIPAEFIAKFAESERSATALTPSWINLEYLTAEPYAQRSHGLPSPIMSGNGAGFTTHFSKHLSKHFFYPGFTAQTGGLLRERNLLARQAAFDRAHWLAGMGIPFTGERLISLFCYEPAALKELLHQLATSGMPTRLLVTDGRAADAVRSHANAAHASLSISILAPLTQTQFDELLWACDLNFVRGEDSLVRAIWAGKPFVWHIYPQHDGAHDAKLTAFLDVMAAPPLLRQFHRVWNGLDDASLPQIDVDRWQVALLKGRDRLLAQSSLTDRLLEFVAKFVVKAR